MTTPLLASDSPALLHSTTPPLQSRAAFLGADSCSSSGCHGGGGEHQNQFLVWSLRDFHSQRPFATLTTARSRQLADALRIADPATDSQCTSCHAPLHQVPAELRGEDLRVSEGVSCESCHGPADPWWRSHTRPDFTRTDRVASGMRDLKNLYVRANTCVACHQTVPTSLLNAGHPELIFELDGQSASQPRHWREPEAASSAQTWLIGQAAALREMSWQLSQEPQQDATLVSRWRGLLWLLQKLDGLNPDFPQLKSIPPDPTTHTLTNGMRNADELARRAAEIVWTPGMTRSALRTLAASGTDFEDRTTAVAVHARRAERLVLALDRLVLPPGNAPGSVDANLNRLFELAESVPDFDPPRFAQALKVFATSLPGE